ncbi:hypothetical protein KQI84_17720 [bacterium]|nr:hypothetical protein [bacterium]
MNGWVVAIGLPVLIFVVLSALLFKYLEHIDEWLSKGGDRRIAAGLIVSLIVPGIASVVLDLADLSAIIDDDQTTDPELLLVTIAGILCSIFLVGQMALWINVDRWEKRLNGLRSQLDQLKDEFRMAKQDHEATLGFTNIFLGVVNEKHTRLKRLRSEESGQGVLDLPRLMKELNPLAQIKCLLLCLYKFLEERLRREDGGKEELRIAYFKLDEEGYYHPIFSWNGQAEGCVSSPQGSHRDCFRLDTTEDRSLVVWCGRHKRIAIIEDAQKAHAEDHVFRFFDQSQQDHIGSILAVPISLGDEQGPISHILSIDTSKRRFFLDNQKTQTQWKWIAKHFAQRALYEEELQEITQSEG